ncbi:hypothetical protein HAHE_42060 [Haloferula helveola]|uniref:FecR protein domain-containing protein n=1 Tax=Haloferula helveola TaxID=490095 RepID=A0ABN6HA07_9BACT|nr:hypothetical protein HAHE_42060 [Haloferula helveola]
MNSRHPGRRKLEQLLQDFEDSNISSADHRQLMDLLRGEPELRLAYLKHMAVATGLHEVAESWAATHGPPAPETHEARERRILKRSFLAAAAVLFLLLAIGSVIAIRERLQPPVRIVEGQGSLWMFESGGVGEDGEFVPGTMLLVDNGSLEITTRTKSRIVLEGPAKLELRGEKLARLHEGKAWFDISERDTGFTVTTARVRVVDLGTRFGVVSSDGSDLVQVDSGRVRIESLSEGPAPLELHGGQAARANVVGRSAPEAYDPDLFLSTPAPAEDPAVWAYYPFDHDCSDQSGSGRDGALVDNKPHGSSKISRTGNDFRFGGGALDLGSDRDFVSVPSKTFSSGSPYAVSFWARKAPGDQGQASWWDMVIGVRGSKDFFIALGDANGDDGRTGLRWRGNTEAPGARQADFDAPDDSSWHHHVIIADGAGSLSYYLDGIQRETAENVETGFGFDSIGDAYGTGLDVDFHGQIDEVWIFEDSIGPGVVRSLFRGSHRPGDH